MESKGTTPVVKAEMPLLVSEAQDIYPPVPPQIHAVPGTFLTAADLRRFYVASRLVGAVPAISMLPKPFDDLTREYGCDIYAQMEKDSEISAALSILILAATSTQIRIIPSLPSTHPQYEASRSIAQFCQWLISTSEWANNDNRRLLVRNGLMFGTSLGELIFDVQKGGEYDGFTVVTDMHVLEPEHTGMVVDNFNKFLGVIPRNNLYPSLPQGELVPLQMDFVNGTARVGDITIDYIIPRSKFLHLAWNRKSSSPQGSSILRPAYTPWWAKQQILEQMLQWLLKYAQPSIWGTVSDKAVAQCFTDPNTGEQIEVPPTELLLEALQAFRGASALALPPGTEVNTLNVAASGNIFLEMLAWADREITRSVLMQHMATSESAHMSRSSSESHQDVLGLLIRTLREWQADAIRRDIIRPLVLYNYGEDYLYMLPEVDAGYGDGFPLGAQEVAQLAHADWFDDSQRSAIDRILGIPLRRTG